MSSAVPSGPAVAARAFVDLVLSTPEDTSTDGFFARLQPLAAQGALACQGDDAGRLARQIFRKGLDLVLVGEPTVSPDGQRAAVAVHLDPTTNRLHTLHALHEADGWKVAGLAVHARHTADFLADTAPAIMRWTELSPAEAALTELNGWWPEAPNGTPAAVAAGLQNTPREAVAAWSGPRDPLVMVQLVAAQPADSAWLFCVKAPEHSGTTWLPVALRSVRRWAEMYPPEADLPFTR